MEYRIKRKLIAIRTHKWVARPYKYLRRTYDKAAQTNAHLKDQLLEFLPYIVAAVITGALAVGYSAIFHLSEELSFFIYRQNKALMFIVTPVMFLLSWWLVRRYAPLSKGSGIPQVMAAVELTEPNKTHLIKKLLSLRIILIKILSSAVKVVGGGIAGREGPTIQISSSIFNKIYHWLPSWWMPISQRNMLIAGAASGLAAAFNTPLGGIIFAIEELSKFHFRNYIYPLFIAIIIAGLTAQGFTGSYLYLGYPITDISGFKVYGGILVVAAACGFLGAKMCNWILAFMRFVNDYKNTLKQGAIVVACSLVVATFIYFLGTETMGSGKEIMERTLFTENKTVDWYLPFVRIGGLITSFGFGGAGGVFAPSLSSGASLGALVAEWFGITGSNANIVILVGMASFLTAVTRAPFTSAIIIFEMTDRHSIIFFLLLGTLVSNIIAVTVHKRSFYSILKENYLHEVEKDDVPQK
jgi:H+/Cl- antiporter ClcA